MIFHKLEESPELETQEREYGFLVDETPLLLDPQPYINKKIFKSGPKQIFKKVDKNH